MKTTKNLLIAMGILLLMSLSVGGTDRRPALGIEQEYVPVSDTKELTNYASKGKKRLIGTVTLSGGCVVNYNILVTWSLVPPSLTVNGTVTMSGLCQGTQGIQVPMSGKAEITEKYDIVDFETINPFLPSLKQNEFDNLLNCIIQEEISSFF